MSYAYIYLLEKKVALYHSTRYWFTAIPLHLCVVWGCFSTVLSELSSDVCAYVLRVSVVSSSLQTFGL